MSSEETRMRELARHAVEMTDADQAEAVVTSSSVYLTRFADNRIHQNVAETNVGVSVRAVIGKKQGVASTNRLEDEAIAECAASAVAAAKASPEDHEFPGLPSPGKIVDIDRAVPATREFDAESRARAAKSLIDQSVSRDLTAAGAVRVADHTLAVANSLGVDAGAGNTGLRATVLSTGPAGGTGWASFTSADASELAAAALGDEAATLAERAMNPSDLTPGEYTVVLSAEAVADIVDFLGYVGFSARALEEGRSFMSGRIGEKLISDRITIVDDALASFAMGPTFDFEGVPKRRVTLIDAGIAASPVTDSYWAARTGRENTGHALPAPNAYGPMPINLEMAGGDATIDELISEVDRGVYVTRFHYVNVEDPVPVTLTGMTRDGTFLIEDGHLTRPLKNQRFTQSMIEALSDVRGITAERRFVGTEMGASYVPSLLLGKFSFTGQTG